MKHRLAARASVVALTVSMLVGVASTTSAAPSPARPERKEPSGVGSITFGPCEDPTLDFFGAECGTLSVPLDYSEPRGEKIQLAVSRVRHTVPDEQYQGIMLTNPGGPGGSGLIFSIFGAFMPGGSGAAYDWIGFDPRGVGSSVPALSCIPDYSAGPRPAYDPVTPSVEQAWLQRVRDYAEACGEHGGELLDHLKTTDNARDMNAIREALGSPQLNYYGWSYGTYLGQVFATMFPSKVRRMVLDSNVDPRNVWYDANISQDFAFEKVINLFFNWVARHDSTYHLGTTGDAVEAAYYAAKDDLAAAPRGELGPAEWADALLLAGYVQGAWPDVASAFAAFVNDAEPGPITDLFLGFVDTTNDNGYAMYLATECTDAHWPHNWSFWRRDNNRVATQAPFLTWDNAWFNAPCAFWPARADHTVNVRGNHAPPILLLDETLDAATPFSGSIEVRQRFRKSVLVATEGGTTHASSPGANECVDERIAAYLLDGELPARLRSGPDVVCPANPEPEPASAAVARSQRATVVTLDRPRPGLIR